MNTPPILLTELAERVEKLTGPCRETDVAIWAAITPADTWRRVEPGKSYSTWQIRDNPESEWRDYYPGLNAKHYTASLDAAMTLVPSNHRWLMNGPDVDDAGDDIRPCAAVMPYGVSLFLPRDTRQAATPVLAFLSAVLRARASSGKDD